MHIIKKKTLEDYYHKHVAAEKDLDAWFYEVKHARWKTPADIKARYSSASFLSDNRVVFNIHGNDYRLLTRINYESETVFIKFVGTHSEYDRCDMEGNK